MKMAPKMAAKMAPKMIPAKPAKMAVKPTLFTKANEAKVKAAIKKVPLRIGLIAEKIGFASPEARKLVDSLVASGVVKAMGERAGRKYLLA